MLDELDLSVRDIIERIKKIEKFKLNKEVAEALGMDERNLASCKHRNQVPIYRLLAYAKRNNVNLNKLLWG